MKRIILTLFLIMLQVAAITANAPVIVKEVQVPILIDRSDNPLFYIRVESQEHSKLTDLKLNFGADVDLKMVESIKLYYSGIEAPQRMNGVYYTPLTFPLSYIPRDMPGQAKAAHSSYSIKMDEVKSPSRNVNFECDKTLFAGVNYFWVSIEMSKSTPLTTKVTATISEVKLDNQSLPIEQIAMTNKEHLLGYGVRHSGDDEVNSFRIPGLVTSNKGTLLGVYDIRYNSSVDAQEHIDIGLSRSTDGGQSWEPMRIIIAFGNDGGMPAAQNGACDPSILVDEKSGTIWVVALWTQGMGNYRAFGNSKPGMSKTTTGQLVLVKSTDDGKSWSDPINITEQVKEEQWNLLFQGPGRGITMRDGTLVFPIQYVDENKVPNAGIMYSKDSGETWTIHNHAHTNATESQVVELGDGTLMLNMRDNRKGSRSIYTTKDLGKTWVAHSSNRSALQESVCMASLIRVEAKDNVLGKDILFFSNPNTTKGRHSMTIKASLDEGKTWSESNQLLLDEEKCWGYSCLTQIDQETIGILYEGSQAHMLFQAVKIEDIIAN